MTLKVTGIDGIQHAIYHILLVISCNNIRILYHFWNTISYFTKFKEFTGPEHIPFAGNLSRMS